MKIALVTEFFAPHIGGMEVRFEKFAEALTCAGMIADIYTIDYTGGLPKHEKFGKTDVYRYVTIKGYASGTNRNARAVLNYSIATSKLLNKINSEYDLIIVNQMPVMHLLYMKNYKNVVVDWCEYWPGGIKHMLLKRAAKRFMKGICVSEYILKNLKGLNSNGKFKVVYTPIKIRDYKTTRKSESANKLLYVGRLAEHKNLLNLIEGVTIANKDRKRKFLLSIAGEGPLLKQVRNAAAKKTFIKVFGAVSDAEKLRLFKSSDIFVMPSRREGLPNTLLEAIASELPIIMVKSRQNNAASFVESRGIGIVATDHSAAAIAKALLKLDKITVRRIRSKEAALASLLDFDRVKNELNTML